MNTRRHIIALTILMLGALPGVTFAATMQVSRPWVQASGLVGYWSFNNLDLTDKVYDRSGQGNDAYFEGGATSSAKVPGRLGQGMRFDGVNDQIDVYTPALTGATDVPFSWSFWHKTTSNDGDEMIGWGASRRCRLVTPYAYHSIGCSVSGDEYAAGAVQSTTMMNDGMWHHVVYTHNAGVQKLYVDGVLEDTGSETFTTDDVYFSLGHREFGAHHSGSLDEVRIYNRALTAAEANALYRAGQVTVAKTLNTGVKSGLTGWWTFDGKDVQGAAPGSGNSGSILPSTAGTLSGGTLFWANTGNILAEDSAYADVTLSGTAQSNYLRASNFGFSIPADATIVGIEGDIKRRRIGGTQGDARDYSVRLVDDTGAVVGSNKAWTLANWPITGDWACNGVGCYGGPSDMWGTSLTPAQVNDSDFGMALQATGDAAGANRQALVDAIDIVIYYTTPGGAIDRSGSGNHGSINGARVSIGKVGQGMQFNGATSDVDLGASAISNFANPMSTCAWVRSSDVTADQTIVVNSLNNDINNAFNFYIANSEINFTHASGGAYTGAAKTSGLTKNTWAHFCATWSGGTTKLYKDGTEMTGLTGDPGYQDDENLIGSRVGIFDRVWNGTIDDVRIYSRALSAAEIKKIYNEGLGVTIGKSQPSLVPSGLVGYWSFNGSSVNWTTNTMTDMSGNGNTMYIDGVATRTAPTIGKLGQAFRFNGVDETVSTLTAPFPSLPSGVDTPFTFAWWKKSSGLTSEEISWSNYRWCRTGGISFHNVSCTVDGDDTGGTVSTTWVDDDNWHHIVYTHSAGTQKLYVDGVLEDTANETFSTNIGEIMLGSRPFGAYYEGVLDEVRIYNRALTAAEVKRLYDNGK